MKVIELTNEEYNAIMEARESSHKRIEKLADKAYDKSMGFYPGASERKKAYNDDDVAGRSYKLHKWTKPGHGGFDSDAEREKYKQILIKREKQQQAENLANAHKAYGVNR